jgi:hypothetical protein
MLDVGLIRIASMFSPLWSKSNSMVYDTQLKRINKIGTLVMSFCQKNG